MTLVPGSRLGPYEVSTQLGEGGMGVVYRARDTRLGREVAIKVLPRTFAEDPERLRRFEAEARAVGRLSHPNILAVFDTGSHDGAPYLVMELLEGETLRDRMDGRRLSPKRAVDIALQIAHGLTAAHGQGIIHRDLKPENVFITRDGQVKILDFGLAKATGEPALEGATEALELPVTGQVQPGTAVGTLVGTVGYMSPEQVRGDQLDGRSDLFCLGLLLWEMLTGRRPFHRTSTIETLHAILKEEPQELEGDPRLPPMLEKVLHTCLAKDPAGRFHSAHDLAFALEASSLSGTASFPNLSAPALGARRNRQLVVAAAAAAVLLLAGGAWAWARLRPRPAPSFSRLTFAPGLVDTAFFSGDGRSIFYCGRFQGQRPEIFVRSPESPEPRPLEAQGAVLVGVSASNQLAVLRDPHPSKDGFRGTLAQMPVAGGASRDLLEDALEAVWDAEGQIRAAILGDQGFRSRLEFPVGKVVHTSVGELKLLKASPHGDRLAMVEGTGDRTRILAFDGSGQPQVLMTKNEDMFGATITGLAWHPGGRELWVSDRQGDQTVLWALDPRGARRMVWRGPGVLQLLDIATDGRVLMAVQRSRRGVFLQLAGQALARDLSILDGTQALAFLPDGKTLLLYESPAEDGGTSHDVTYLRNSDGRPAVRLAKGNPRSLSPDGKYIAINTYEETGEDGGETALAFIPVGAGLPVTVPLKTAFEGLDDGVLFDHGHKVLFAGMEKGKDWQFFVADRGGGAPRAFTPIGVRAPRPLMLSPGGDAMIGTTTTPGQYVRYPLDGGPPKPIKGLLADEQPIAWTRDGIYVASRRLVLPVRVLRLDPDSGQRKPMTSFMPPDPAGYLGTLSVHPNADGTAFAYTYYRKTSDLYLVEGLH